MTNGNVQPDTLLLYATHTDLQVPKGFDSITQMSNEPLIIIGHH